MALDLTPADGVRSATGLLVAAFGAWLYARGPTSPRARPLAIFLVAFGLDTGILNLRLTATAFWVFPQPAITVIDAIALLALARLFLLEMPAGRRRVAWCVAFGIAAGLLSSVPAYLASEEGFRLDAAGSWLRFGLGLFGHAQFYILCGLMGSYALLAALRSRDAPEAEARALAAIGPAIGLYPIGYFLTDPFLLLTFLAALSGGVPAFLAIAAWGRARAGNARDAATLAFGLLLGVALATVLLHTSLTGRDLGIIGIVRVIMVGILAFGIFRWGALGERLRPARDRRAALLTGFLVVLLIVAQIAQNFLSAQYGLLLGGVIAGALLVAARPIERALEDRRPAPVPGPDVHARERSYRSAARKFLARDGYLSREEERDLMVLAEHLGIPVSRAYAIRDELEKERRA